MLPNASLPADWAVRAFSAMAWTCLLFLAVVHRLDLGRVSRRPLPVLAYTGLAAFLGSLAALGAMAWKGTPPALSVRSWVQLGISAPICAAILSRWIAARSLGYRLRFDEAAALLWHRRRLIVRRLPRQDELAVTPMFGQRTRLEGILAALDLLREYDGDDAPWPRLAMRQDRESASPGPLLGAAATPEARRHEGARG